MDAAAVFWALHSDLPREAPGSAATTRALLDLAGPLPPGARAVDIGCGPGRSAEVLAEAGLRVTAVDLHEPFLRRARRAGTGTFPVAVVRADMAALPLREGSADLVWSEGAAYLMGVDAALRSWRRLLRPGGVLVLTDAVWTTAAPSAAARAFWAAYAGMRDVPALVAAARATGYDVLAERLLPDSDWAGYYDPLAAAIAAWPDPDEETAVALAGARAEIDLRRAHADEYGYAAVVLRRGGQQVTR
ncbi:class I SAM-dependent methyltransferase [Geodermatophilus marinus]|uniref:class I SAM-dependent methyltransferase n=1 Tax=Geodermatophilus sp. LHW52908 TaxID=2303986 RepID=UPI000E3C6D00|nr:class I SAM-dependent methyltransferase [Geodermatophilus sp. LHW52908]RFU22270.1 class I SAM-dependent methyltransferase [Geodermatophilus sp. LHW52908]